MPSKVREKTQKQWSDSIHWVSEEIKISCIGLTSHRHYSRNWEATYREHVEQEWNFDWLIFTGAWVEFIPEERLNFQMNLGNLYVILKTKYCHAYILAGRLTLLQVNYYEYIKGLIIRKKYFEFYHMKLRSQNIPYAIIFLQIS